MIGIATVLVGMFFIGLFMALKPDSRYPDGRCYLCRSGECWPGDDCPKCGEHQYIPRQ